MAVRAVIFDMDGVIVDSEPYSMQALIDILRQYGIEPTQDELQRSYGRRVRDDFVDYFSRHGVTADVNIAIAHKHARYYHLAAGHLQPLPGVVTLLQALARPWLPPGLGLLRGSRQSRVWDAGLGADRHLRSGHHWG